MKKILIFIFLGIAITCMAAYSIRTTGKSTSLKEFNAELLADVWDEPVDTDTVASDTTQTGEPGGEPKEDTTFVCCYSCTGQYCGVYGPPGDTILYPIYYEN